LAPELARTYPQTEIHVMTRAEPMLESVWAVCDRRGIDRLAGGAHAGEVEASMLLAGAPELTEMDRAQPGLLAVYSEYAERAHKEGLQAVSPNGILGDPSAASPDAGYDYLMALAEHHAREYREGRMRIQP
jgi:mycofactocin precursor peptide peptidase